VYAFRFGQRRIGVVDCLDCDWCGVLNDYRGR
jgi:hypothetical protein